MAVFYVGHSLTNDFFAAKYLFSPIIFSSLILLFLSRLLIGIPLSTTGLGKLTAVITTLGVAATAAASSLVFGEAYSPRVIVGIALGMVAVLLIGEG